MPEGDTVFRTRPALREAPGTTLTRCDIRVPRYATVDLPVGSSTRCSAGASTCSSGVATPVSTHLKMDGSWRVTRGGRSRAGRPQGPTILRPATSGRRSRSRGARGARPRARPGTRSPTRAGSGDDWIRTARRRTRPPTRLRPIAAALLISGCWPGSATYCKRTVFRGSASCSPARSALPDLLRVKHARERCCRVNRLRPTHDDRQPQAG